MPIIRAGGLVEGELTDSVINAFHETYNTLDFGFVEPVYASALAWELRSRNHQVQREVAVSVFYKGHRVAWQRLDMVVDGRVAIEIKALEILPPSATRQLRSYLRATQLEVGLLINFGRHPQHFRLFEPNKGSVV